ncbi:hypothetical protein QF001_001648 [Paraburkholderia youngii]|uniref:hypothetical protein n=1 Tax=Paraburkholderia youngii TaxID=2782701 RepID=UPI003D229139
MTRLLRSKSGSWRRRRKIRYSRPEANRLEKVIELCRSRSDRGTSYDGDGPEGLRAGLMAALVFFAVICAAIAAQSRSSLMTHNYRPMPLPLLRFA